MTRILHLSALLLSIWLLISVSYDVLHHVDYWASRGWYLLICALLLGDFLLLWRNAPDKRCFWRSQWPLLIVSLPLSLVADLLLEPRHPEFYHLLRFLPLIRGFFSLYVIIGWWVSSLRGQMLLTYLFVSACVVYYTSLLFYNCELKYNPAVNDYADALWWASMNFTTIGSNIIAVSVVGKVLGVLMGFCGMMMLPVFTAFYMSVLNRRGDD